jgi:hypothetical protein
MIFSPVWSLLTLAVLMVVPWKMPRIAESPVPKALLVGLEGLTMLYWFGGFIALAVFLSDRICFGTVCSVAKASTAISAFSWVVWVVTAAWNVKLLFDGRLRRGGAGMEPKVEMHQGV